MQVAFDVARQGVGVLDLRRPGGTQLGDTHAGARRTQQRPRQHPGQLGEQVLEPRPDQQQHEPGGRDEPQPMGVSANQSVPNR